MQENRPLLSRQLQTHNPSQCIIQTIDVMPIHPSNGLYREKKNSPEQEGFRPGRFCSRAITHLSLYIEDAHTHNSCILITYVDFTQTFPSADHLQLESTLCFLGIPEDFIFIVAILYRGAHTTFEHPHGKIRKIPVLRGTLQGDPFFPLLFLLMVEPLIR